MISCALQQIEELANIGRQGEKGEFNSKQGLIHSLQRCSPAWGMPYLRTIGRFKFFRWAFRWLVPDENSNFTFQLWTVPERGRFSYNLVVFAKGGIIYRFPLLPNFIQTGGFFIGWCVLCWRHIFMMSLYSLACCFSSTSTLSCIALHNICSGAASNATWQQTTSTGRQIQISPQCQHLLTNIMIRDHLDLLKLTALQKLRSEFKDLTVRWQTFHVSFELTNGPAIKSFFDELIVGYYFPLRDQVCVARRSRRGQGVLNIEEY